MASAIISKLGGRDFHSQYTDEGAAPRSVLVTVGLYVCCTFATQTAKVLALRQLNPSPHQVMGSETSWEVLFL